MVPFGVSHEWHLDFPKAVQQLAFGLVPWFHEAIIRLGTALSAARFNTIRSISNSVGGDGVK